MKLNFMKVDIDVYLTTRAISSHIPDFVINRIHDIIIALF